MTNSKFNEGDGNERPLLEFPCWFPVKAFGKNDHAFEDLVAGIVRRHVSKPEENIISSQESNQGKFLAVTVRFMAENQAQIDRIYTELNDHPHVLMLL